jgi:hypothetical protein
MSNVDMSSLSKGRQREIGALKIATDRVRERNDSTVPLTVHVSADTIEWLTIVGGDVFKDYPAKVRRRMASEGSALPDGSFPIANCSDAADAIHSIGRADPAKRSQAEAHIRKRVKALGCSGSVYENWS